MPGAPEGIPDSLNKLTEPASYFAGTPQSSFRLPEALLMFHRGEARVLGPVPACHHRFVLIVNCLTSGSVIIDERSFRLLPGSALLIYPHQFHHFLNIEAAHTSWLFITFEQRDADHLLPLRNVPVPVSERGWGLLRALLQAYRPPETAGRADATRTVLCGALLLHELVERAERITRGTSAPEPGQQQKRIVEINRYVWRNMSRKLSVGDVARRFALSESQMRTVFRKATGISLGTYIARMRFNRASGLLLNSEMNITEVATECGFDSLFAFSRAFRNRMGVSPRQYRRERMSAGRV